MESPRSAALCSARRSGLRQLGNASPVRPGDQIADSSPARSAAGSSVPGRLSSRRRDGVRRMPGHFQLFRQPQTLADEHHRLDRRPGGAGNSAAPPTSEPRPAFTVKAPAAAKRGTSSARAATTSSGRPLPRPASGGAAATARPPDARGRCRPGSRPPRRPDRRRRPADSRISGRRS